MKTIHKYPLATMREKIAMPMWAEVVAFQLQHDVPTIWAEHSIPMESNKVERKFHVVGTGFAVPDEWDYVSTLQQGPFVWHLYEEQQL